MPLSDYEHWSGILHRVLNDVSESSSDLVVPEGIEFSVYKHSTGKSTNTMGEGAIIKTLATQLQGDGTRTKRGGTLSAKWEDIQSITFSYKRSYQHANKT
jgi:hypothetical protein